MELEVGLCTIWGGCLCASDCDCGRVMGQMTGVGCCSAGERLEDLATLLGSMSGVEAITLSAGGGGGMSAC